MSPDQSPSDSPHTDHLQAKAPVRVLIVDDYEDNRTMLRLMLKRKAIEVLEAADGQQAVEIASQQQPDLILMDLSMPVMDGFEATRQLKLLETTKHIPVLALSAHCHDPAQSSKALESGCTDCFVKPLPLEKLAAYLKDL